MSKNYKREHKNTESLNDHELDALKPALELLGKGLGDITKKEINNLLRLVYSVPDNDRGDAESMLTHMRIAQRVLKCVHQYVLEYCSNVPEIREALSQMIYGNPGAISYEEKLGLQGLMDEIIRRGLGESK